MDLVEHYTALYRQYGDDPRAVQLADRITQNIRFDVLMRVMEDRKHASVIDVGCGLGHLYEFLLGHGFQGDYSGVDINPVFVDRCREKFKRNRFEVCDISETE